MFDLCVIVVAEESVSLPVPPATTVIVVVASFGILLY